MRRNSPVRASLVAVWLSGACLAAEPVPQPQQVTAPAALAAAELERAARQLGDADPDVRKAAAATLRAAGAGAAEPALRGVIDAGEPEAARRAQALLRQLTQAEPEEQPLPDPDEIAAYRNANRDAKLNLINQLGGAAGARGAALPRLWLEEEEPEFRAAIFAAMLTGPATSATGLLAYGNEPQAEQLLEAALAQGNTEAAAPYAALCMARGTADEAIARWTARAARAGKADAPAGQPAEGGAGGGGGDMPAVAGAVLARLHRVAGNPAAAAAAAHRAGDPSLLEESLLAAGDWPTLAQLVAARPAPIVRPRQLGLLAGAAHLAGDAGAFAGALERMRRVANAETLDDVAAVLLMCGKVDEGMRALADEPAAAVQRFRLLVSRERLGEAFDLVAAQDARRDEPALRLRIAAAEQWHALGEDARAAALVARVAEDNKALRSQEVHAALGEAHRRMDQPGEAWAQFREAMKVDATGRGAGNRAAWRAFRVEPAGGAAEPEVSGTDVWTMLQEQFPAESLDQRFERARAVIDGTASLGELAKLADVGAGADAGDGRGAGFGGRAVLPVRYRAYAANLVRLVGQRMRDAGKPADAERYMVRAAELAPAPQHAAALYLRLGDWAAERAAWTAAANWYGRAWNADRTRPAPLYLRAWAVREAGWPARGGELTRLARTLPLADPWRRYESLRTLHERGLRAALAQEVGAVLATARPELFPADLAMRLRADRAERDGDWLAAAAWTERSMLNHMSSDLVDPVAYLRIPHTVHRHRARGLLARGDVDAAEREIAAARALLPGDVTLAIDAVPEFERLGNKARADELYAEAKRAQDEALAKYPNSANHHNNAAWLAANCGRDADQALAHARRAVELRRNRTAYIDTLAEVQFRRGDLDGAIATIKRCIALEPKSPRHREQLERFEAGKRGEQRAMPPG